MTERRLTHLDAEGRARMVDVSGKDATARTAVARGRVAMSAEAARLAMDGDAPKGDVRATAEIAGVMAGKRTADLIPMCHPLALSKLEVSVSFDETGAHVTATAKTTGPTGVEMEALTAVSAACLTVYDMLKAIDRTMRIGGIELVEKTGGRSGDWRRPEERPAPRRLFGGPAPRTPRGEPDIRDNREDRDERNDRDDRDDGIIWRP